MFYIVETQNQLQKLLPQEECYINVIPLSNNYHPILSEVSLIYYKVKDQKGIIFPISHSEGFSLDLQIIKDFISYSFAVSVKVRVHDKHTHVIFLRFFNQG